MVDVPTQVVDYFLGESTTFGLTISEAQILESKLDMGVGLIEMVFRANQQKIDQMREVLRFGLIGGGMEAKTADEKIQLAVQAGSILQHVDLCHRILIAFLGPLEPEQPKKTEAPKAKAKRSK